MTAAGPGGRPGDLDVRTERVWNPQPHRSPYPPVRPRRRSLTRALAWVLVVLLILGTGVLAAAAVAAETGPVGFAAGTVLAAIPVVPVVAVFLWLDRYEAEPRVLLLFAFAWGAAVATFVSLVLNTASVVALQQTGGDPTLAAVVVAPVVEELTKALAVVGVLLLRRREFDGVVDGIVYAGLAGIGFAFVENVLYLGRALDEGGVGGAFTVFLLRGVLSPFAHPLFTIAFGIGLGLAVSRRRGVLRLLAPVLGYLVAVALHAAWNLSAVSGMAGFFSAYVSFQVPVFLGVVLLALLARRRESRLIRRHLDAYARTGWLTEGEVRMLRHPDERRAARGWAARTGGPDAARAMRDFQELATELAFLRERMSHGTAPDDARQAELATLHTLRVQRTGFLPRWTSAAGL